MSPSPWEQAPGILWITDNKLNITEVVGAGLEYLDIPQQGNVGKNLLDILGHSDPNEPTVRAHLQALKGETGTYVNRFKDRIFFSQINPHRSASGEIIGTIGVALDFTDRAEAQDEEIRKATQSLKFQKALLSLAQGQYGDLPQALKQITSIDAQTLGVERVSVWFFNEDRDAIFTELLYIQSEDRYEADSILYARDYPKYFKALEASRTISAEKAQEDPRTKEFRESYLRPLNISSMLDVPIRLSGTVVGIVCHEHVGEPRSWNDEEQSFAASVADMVSLAIEASERKKAEQALRKTTDELMRSNQELEQFAYVASHDLQEPLHKIIAFTDRLEDTLGTDLQKNSKAKDYFDRLSGGAQRMRQLIEDLLQVARITTRAQPFVEMNLQETLKEVLSDLELKIQNSQAKITILQLPRVMGDPRQLQQLFQNLLSNAIKFSQKGSIPEIFISSKRLDNNLVEITVRDNGIGIDPSFWEKIFRPFQRLHSRDQFEGSGMGLTLCKKIVDRHGGKITVFSELGKGSEFKLLLPGLKEAR